MHIRGSASQVRRHVLVARRVGGQTLLRRALSYSLDLNRRSRSWSARRIVCSNRARSWFNSAVPRSGLLDGVTPRACERRAMILGAPLTRLLGLLRWKEICSVSQLLFGTIVVLECRVWPAFGMMSSKVKPLWLKLPLGAARGRRGTRHRLEFQARPTEEAPRPDLVCLECPCRASPGQN